MSTGTRPPTDPRTRDGAPARSDRSPWNWLLLVAVVVPLLVPFYNRVEPTLFGWPFFYWAQLAFVPLGVLATFLAYRATRRRPTAGRTDRER
jgi:membrane protein implicated in regulation of membrane protease activity